MVRYWMITPAILALGACTQGHATASQADSLRTELAAVNAKVATMDSARVAEQTRLQDSIRAEAVKPRELALFNDAVIAPLGYKAFGFTLDQAGDCRLAGRIEVAAGGSGKDVQLAVFDHDGFINWKNNPHRPSHALRVWPLETITTLNVPLLQEGTYYLVVSNMISIFSSKTVTGSPTVTCIGHPTPVATD